MKLLFIIQVQLVSDQGVALVLGGIIWVPDAGHYEYYGDNFFFWPSIYNFLIMSLVVSWKRTPMGVSVRLDHII